MENESWDIVLSRIRRRGEREANVELSRFFGGSFPIHISSSRALKPTNVPSFLKSRIRRDVSSARKKLASEMVLSYYEQILMGIEDSSSRILRFQSQRIYQLSIENVTGIKIMYAHLKNLRDNTSRRQIRFSRNLLMKLRKMKDQLSAHYTETNELWENNCLISNHVGIGDSNLPSLKSPTGNDTEFLYRTKLNYELVDIICCNLKFNKFMINGINSNFFHNALKCFNYTLLAYQDCVSECLLTHSVLLICLKCFRTVFECLDLSNRQALDLWNLETMGYRVERICDQLFCISKNTCCNVESGLWGNEIIFELFAVVKYFIRLYSSPTCSYWRFCHAVYDSHGNIAGDDIESERESLHDGCNDVFIREHTKLNLLRSMILHLSRSLQKICALTGEEGKIGFFMSDKEAKWNTKHEIEHIMNVLIHVLTNGIIPTTQMDVLDAVRRQSAFIWKDSEIQSLFLKSLASCILCSSRVSHGKEGKDQKFYRRLSSLIEISVGHTCSVLKSHLRSSVVAYFGLLFIRLYAHFYCDILDLEEFLSKEFVEINEDGVKLVVVDSDNEDEKFDKKSQHQDVKGKLTASQVSAPLKSFFADDQEKAAVEIIEWRRRLETKLFRPEWVGNVSGEQGRTMNTFPDILMSIAQSNTSSNLVIEQVLLFAYQMINRSIVAKLAMIEVGLKEYVSIVKFNSRQRMINDSASFEQYTVALCEIVESALVPSK